jgi:pimeloyl-ACP methyl ester carboxylesterase
MVDHRPLGEIMDVRRLMAGLLPDAQIRVYPDAAHGCPCQYPAEVAADANAFLASREGSDGS